MAAPRPGEELSAALGEKFKRIRLDRKMSQLDVCIDSGLDQAFISRFENGREMNPNVGTLERLAAGLGVTLNVEFVE